MTRLENIYKRALLQINLNFMSEAGPKPSYLNDGWHEIIYLHSSSEESTVSSGRGSENGPAEPKTGHTMENYNSLVPSLKK